MLNGIRIIKYFAWEGFFEKKIQETRKAEMWNLIRLAGVYMAFGLVGYGSSLVVAFTTFTVYTVVAGNELNAATAFTGLLLLGIVAELMGMLPYEIMTILQAKVSVDRIKTFLNEPELERFNPSTSTTDSEPEVVDPPAIGFVAARFSYFSGASADKAAETTTTATTTASSTVPVDENTDLESVGGETLKGGKNGGGSFMLRDVDVRFKIGGLNVVCGATGAGKSSVCLALLGELKRVSGQAYLTTSNPTKAPLPTSRAPPVSVAYVAQTSWLLNATIRDNILMGAAMDEERYNAVLEACALMRDLETLDGGDLTEIGEKGVN
ncbi:hypothetical protein HDU67_005263, partial [Dinochytrium kinnereticum]